MAKKSKISKTEWGMVLGAAATIDVLQIFLDAGAIGVVANRLIDIVMGLALPFYFILRGVKLNGKRVIALALSFIAEEVPIVDALPCWSADVIYTWVTVTAEEKGIPLPTSTVPKLKALQPRSAKEYMDIAQSETEGENEPTYAQEQQEAA